MTKRGTPGAKVVLPHWLTPEFAKEKSDQHRRVKAKNGEIKLVPILPKDQQERYVAISKGKDWGSPPADLTWMPEYTGYAAYDSMKAEMFIGRPVVSKDGKVGKVTRISPNYPVVEVKFNGERKLHRMYVYELSEWTSEDEEGETDE